MSDLRSLTTPLRWALSFAWRTRPRLVNLLGASTLLAALLPAATTLALGFTVAAAYRQVRDSPETLDVRPAATWFAVSLAFMLGQGMAAALRRYSEQRLGDVLNLELSSRVLEHAATLDLAFFEDAESQDTLSRAAVDPGQSFLRFFVAAASAAGSAVLCLSLVGVLLWVYWLAAPALVLRARAGTIDVAGLATFTLAGVRLRTAASDLATAVGAAREGSLFLTYVTEFLGREPAIASGSMVSAPSAGAPRIELDGVGFTYPGGVRPALEGLSLAISPGSVVALVGHNGSGKSTLAKLLARLYEPTAGTIRVDGEPLAAIDLASWHRRVSLVAEQPVTYEASLHENIALGDWRNLLEDRPAVERIARDAGLDVLAAGLPQGMDTPLGRSFGTVDLSRGQWQRVAIARALAHDPGLLILDEPTANLDAEAEAQLYAAVKELAHGRTTVFISHRFSTVRLAETIFVLEAGRLVEAGSHRELMAAEGLYARLYLLHHSESEVRATASGALTSAAPPGRR